jgi:LacI family transcriptional regulator, galactose operon repressor
MPTIGDIATRSGVSTATVSRVLNGTAVVSPVTRDRVEAAMRELDYRPRAAARTLARQRSHLVAVVTATGIHSAFQHPFFQGVLEGLGSTLREAGYDLLLVQNETVWGGPPDVDYARRALDHQVDGVVLLGLLADDGGARLLLQAGVAAVAVEWEGAGDVARVSSDNRAGGVIAARHLHETGRTRLATIAGIPTSSSGRDRLDGFLAAAAELGIPVPPERIVHGDFHYESGRTGMRQLLALPSPPDAVFAASDVMAIAAIHEAQEAGLAVPRDVAVVGFDDVPLAALVRPALTTVHQDRLGLGKAAAEALLQLHSHPHDEPLPATVLPVKLVVRDSA